MKQHIRPYSESKFELNLKKFKPKRNLSVNCTFNRDSIPTDLTTHT